MIGVLLIASAHAVSLTVAARMANMTLDHALKIVKPEAVALFQEQTEKKVHIRGHMKNYDVANKILTDMIAETVGEQDALNMECERIPSKLRLRFEEGSARIAIAEQRSTDAFAEINRASAQQKQAQESLRNIGTELDELTEDCRSKKELLDHQVDQLNGDRNVTRNIVKMVKCDETSLMQCTFLQKGGKAKKGYYAFDHPAATEAMSTLQTKTARKEVQRALSQLYDGADPVLFQMGTKRRRHQRRHIEKVLLAKSAKQNPIEVPLSDTVPDQEGDKVVPSGVGPDRKVKVAPEPLNGPQQESKCVLGKSTNCRKFQIQMMHMQGSIEDKLFSLRDELHTQESHCESQKETLDQQMADSLKLIQDAEVQVAAATGFKTQGMQTARVLSIQMTELREEIATVETKCDKKNKEYEETLCALQKIRNEMWTFQGLHLVPEDCEVTEWIQDECSASCGKGVRTDRRTIITPPKNEGAPCPALRAVIDCNVKPCPVDCIVGEWDGWSACTADCGGGVQTRNRKEMRSPEHGGKNCDQEQQTQICNSENCDQDCVLSEWTGWTMCSKACDTGFQHRNREVIKEAKGAGECPSSDEREQLRSCNLHNCPSDIMCASELDIVLLLDASESMGQGAFDTQKLFGSHLVERFMSAGEKIQIGVIEFSGPATLDEWDVCDSGTMSEGGCGIKELSPLTREMETLSADIESAEFIGESTNTAGALAAAKNLLGMGRQHAPSVVLVVMSGRPNAITPIKTAAEKVKESARLVFVPVGHDVDVASLKKLSSQPVHENIIPAETFEDLDTMIPSIVADLCPMISSKSDKSLGRKPMPSTTRREVEEDGEEDGYMYEEEGGGRGRRNRRGRRGRGGRGRRGRGRFG